MPSATVIRMTVIAVITAVAIQGVRGCAKRGASKAITKAVGKTAQNAGDDVVREATELGAKESDRFKLGLGVLHRGVNPKSVALIDEWGRPIAASNDIERRAQQEAATFWEQALADRPAARTEHEVLEAFTNKLDAEWPAGFQTGSNGQTLRITLQTREKSTVWVDLEATARTIADDLSKESARAYLDSVRVR